MVGRQEVQFPVLAVEETRLGLELVGAALNALVARSMFSVIDHGA